MAKKPSTTGTKPPPPPPIRTLSDPSKTHPKPKAPKTTKPNNS